MSRDFEPGDADADHYDRFEPTDTSARRWAALLHRMTMTAPSDLGGPMDAMEGYRMFRGRCRELSEAAVAADPTLTLVRGHYYCPMWNRDEAHWWTVRPDGSIHDPTAEQFPSAGLGIYTPFDGVVECANCGRETTEEAAQFYGNYAFCCGACIGRFVGVPCGACKCGKPAHV